MSKMRRVISLVLALVLTVAGAVASIYMLFFCAVISFKAAGAAGLVLGVGLIWLYSDFIDATPNDRQP
ncbi:MULTISPECIES: hypothetical protein [Bradyrhizobium]|uniref:Uncharacterized protein n=2 Tax=Bradyrhizobium TaxID=374 RepID=A0ABY0QFI0_9BRAD|nr:MULTISPECIES: hypothetical protein [Bradyrhizobium]SDK14363.1 hypothetical protein SAMN05444163_7348 [Bradyrhizobium ottawaense]SEE50849.1 hypothetical protein SAMN05444171_7783 [Bradyrhizobium lablabi]